MRLIVGLGNPGRKYKHTKHNVGFDCLDVLAKKLRCKFKTETKFQGEVVKVGDVVLLKPTTFMNLSGNSVSKVMKYYQIDVDDILVIYDDIDLPTGKLRIRPFGGAGGHNGMKSIIQHIGQEFKRMRVGVGRNEGVHIVHDVLGKFSKEERKLIDETIEKSAIAAQDFAIGASINTVMNRFN